LATQVSPVAHGVHDEVQRAESVSGTQVTPQRWKSVLHARTHEVPSQVTLPWSGGRQIVQVGPQAATVLLATQVGDASVPPLQKPGWLQTTRQLRFWPPPLSHTAMPLLGGTGHAVHEAPQLDTARSDTHVPPTAGQR